MSAASDLTAQLVNCRHRQMREGIYRIAERDYGKNFADHLRDQIEAHHLLLDNEQQIAAIGLSPQQGEQR